MTFAGMQRLPNLFGDCVITENLDGVNVAIDIREPTYADVVVSNRNHLIGAPYQVLAATKGKVYSITANSSRRYLTPDSDNQGFAAWVFENADELVKLGPGRHVGRWWGRKINRNYDLSEQRFSLVNYERWSGPGKPANVHVVPMLYKGPFSFDAIDASRQFLFENGSVAADGFDRPFGLIVYHGNANNMFRVSMDHDQTSANDPYCWCGG